MRNSRHYSDWRQFYIIYKDGREENYGEPRILIQPNRTNTWKALKRIHQNEDVHAVGWKTVKPQFTYK